MTRSRTLVPILSLLLAAVLTLALAGCGGDEPQATQNTAATASAAGGTVGSGATATGGVNLVREDFSLESYRGKPLLLNFWASW